MAVGAVLIRGSYVLLSFTLTRYNEQRRLAERRLTFDATALLQVIAKAVKRSSDSILKFSKIAEGSSYRVFEAVFGDGFAVIARLPYPCTVPRSFGIASEVATMQFLRLHDIPVPQVYDWASSARNAVGSEYIIMAKAEGQELEHTWYTMTVQERMNVMEKIVDMKKRLFQIPSLRLAVFTTRLFWEPKKALSKYPSRLLLRKWGSSALVPRLHICSGTVVEMSWSSTAGLVSLPKRSHYVTGN